MPEIAEYDAVILGAGINGCGTFRDLALQGLRVLLLERGDFCQGASAASSRLMHGGLKYLETGEFRLVKESLTERNMLLATAPHYVHPLECVVPVRSVWGGIMGSAARFLGLKAKLDDRGWLITALGLRLYDLYGRALQAMPDHRMLGRNGLRRMLPDLSAALAGAGIYYEGQLSHAERLGLELVLDAEAANPAARALNHVSLTGVSGDVLTWRDAAGRPAQARARVVINAGGAWIDAINAQLGVLSRLMGGSRGSHLILDHSALFKALDGRMIYFGTPDGRVNLIYPFMGKVLVGATDIPQADPDVAVCTAEEEAYLCAAVAEVFPDLPIRADHVVQRFCGVRPPAACEWTHRGGDAGSFHRHTDAAGHNGAGALPDRRQMDHLPRLCRGGGGSRAGRPWPAPPRHDAGPCHRWRARFPARWSGAAGLPGQACPDGWHQHRPRRSPSVALRHPRAGLCRHPAWQG